MKYFRSYLNKSLKDPELRKAFLRVHFLDDLADQFILLRNKRGVSQSLLAEKANTTQAVVSRVENGSVNSSLLTIRKLAEALDAYVKVDIVPDEEMRVQEFFVNYIQALSNDEKTNEQENVIENDIFISEGIKCSSFDSEHIDIDWTYSKVDPKVMA